MFYVNKITPSEVVDFAAEELKKYLRMMRPDAGDVKISFDKEAKDGFRLGLMSDFGLDTSDVEDTGLDDIIYIDTKANTGIIAGSNPRSVLFAVYEYLKKQGCGFYYPGFDGESIPISYTTDARELCDVKYRFVPTTRYRGQGILTHDLDYIDFLAKQGINTAMIEFFDPGCKEYLCDPSKPYVDAPDLNVNLSKQIKRRCETEAAKRGMHFHDIGHGWLSEAFGFDSSLDRDDKPNRPCYNPGHNESLYTDEQKSVLALKDGKRKFILTRPVYTQICMSNATSRKTVVNYIADYSKTHSNVDYLHVWLADLPNNHCECDACRKMTPSDWYMILMNELDEELTRRNDDMKIAFIVYTDTIWAPLKEKIKNHKRFVLLFAPITRSYANTLPSELYDVKLNPFELNKCKFPGSLYEDFMYLKEWEKAYSGDSIAFEYHFWRNPCFDMSGIQMAKRIYEDARGYEKFNVKGFIQCGYPDMYFPTAFAYYTYAKTLYDKSLTFDEIAEEYFSGVFGKDWKKLYEIFNEMDKLLPFEYLSSPEALKRPNVYVDKARAAELEKMGSVLEAERLYIDSHKSTERRVETLALMILEKHIEFVSLLTEMFLLKAKGENEKAKELFENMKITFGRHKAFLGKYFSYYMYYMTLQYCAKIKHEDSTYYF